MTRCTAHTGALGHGVFRWKRALLHGLIPVGAVVAIGIVLVAVAKPADPEKLGESMGTFVLFAYLAGCGISWLGQTGRRRAAWLGGIALGLVMAAMLALGFIGPDHRTSRSMPGQDRAALVERDLAGTPRLVHPTYGFSIRRPPASYHDSPDLVAQAGLTRDPRSQYYVYAESPPSNMVVVGLLTDLPSSREAFTAAVAGIRKAFTDIEATTILTDETTGSEGHLQTKFHATVAGAHIQIRAYQVQPAGKPPGAVMVMTTTADGTTLGDVLDSFTP